MRHTILGVMVGLALGTTAVVLFANVVGFAQSAAPRPTPPQMVPIAIKAGRVLEATTGTYLMQQLIWIEGDRIKQVGSAADIAPQLPRATRIIDLTSATVLPGLIDCHTHLTVSPETAARTAAAASGPSKMDPTIPRAALLGVRNARITLEAGFTTVRDLGAPGYADLALRDAINVGDIPGPRILAAGRALTGIGGGEVVAIVHENIQYGADVIKFFATGGVLLRNDTAAEPYKPEEMREIVGAAHEAGRKVATHAHGTAGIKDAVLAGADSVEHGSGINEEIIGLMKTRGTYLVPTVYIGDWFIENYKALGLPENALANVRQTAPARRENLARAIREGVKIALGSDSGTFPHGLNARELVAMVRLGMAPLQAIQAATVNAADLLGWSDRVGSLEPGKWADLIAVDGDPLVNVETLEHVAFVMKGGKVVKPR